jgi:hypothetical protein
MSNSLYALLNIVGPLLLGAVLLWAILRNRTSRRERERTEQATKEMYRAQDAKDRERG